MKSKGFTILELLVVVSVISLFSSIVIANISRSREVAMNNAVARQAVEIRKIAALYFEQYGLYTLASGQNGQCLALTDGLFANSDFRRSAQNVLDITGRTPVETYCTGNAISYAVSLPEKTEGAFWCVDSVGKSKHYQYVVDPEEGNAFYAPYPICGNINTTFCC